MEQNNHKFTYRFILQYKVAFGEVVYLSGSTKELGQWNTKKAIQMVCHHDKFWICQIEITLNQQIQFKYFIDKFQKEKNKQQTIKWIGNHNQHLFIDDKQKSHFLGDDYAKLSIMSFNVRFQTQKDKQIYSWSNRKENCVQMIKNYYPDIIGVQEPMKNQHYYRYYGKPRDLQASENSGIFIRKDKFLVLEDGYIWINEGKVDGKKGFGARLPRYFTYLIVKPVNNKASPFIVVNTHLDHQTPLSRQEGIKFISETLNVKSKQYNFKSLNCFVMGDFNTSDDNYIFKQLKLNGEELQSMRYVVPKEESSFQATFNGFSKILKVIDKTMKFFNLDPGATIDHIFIKVQSYVPIKFKTIHVKDKIVSDHYPIVGQFIINKQQN